MGVEGQDAIKDLQKRELNLTVIHAPGIRSTSPGAGFADGPGYRD